MKLLFRREAWRVRVLVVADGKDVPAGMWTQTEESVGQRADFWLPEGANQSRRITLEEDLSVPECQLLSSLYCKWRVLFYQKAWPLKFPAFPSDAVGKNLCASAGEARDEGWIPGSGRSSAVGNSNPLQYSCLENSIDKRGLVGYSPWGRRVGHSWAQHTPKSQSIHFLFCSSTRYFLYRKRRLTLYRGSQGQLQGNSKWCILELQ